MDFTGGEPLLNNDLPLFLHEAKRIGFITSVTTNCLLFPERARELAGLIDLLHFSIDADNAELHDALRGRPSFDRVLRSIDVALENRLYPDLLFTYTDENISSFEGVYRLAREKKLMTILDPVFTLDGRDNVKLETHAQAIEFSGLHGVYLNRAHLTLRSAGGNSSTSPLCRAVDSTVVILPDNRLTLPCFHQRIEFVKLHGDLGKVLAGPVRREAAAMQGRHHFCKNCHLNCYFDPSYGYLRNRLFLQSMAAKLGYAWQKYIVYRRPWPRLIARPAP